MNDKKTEKDLSILDSQDVEIEDVKEEVKNESIDKVVNEDIVVESDNVEMEAEKKPIKPSIIFTSIFLILAIIAVGIFTWYNYTTLATYDGGRVTRAEFNEKLQANILAQGITEEQLNDPSNKEAIQEYKDQLLVSIAYDEVIFKQLENLSVGQLTPEELEKLKEDTRLSLEDYVNSNIDAIISTLPEGYSEKDLENAKEDFKVSALNQIGCNDLDDYIDVRIAEESFFKAYQELLPEDEIAPTDDEVKSEYNKLLEIQKEDYDASPSDYLSQKGSNKFELYVPSGIRMVRHVLIKIDDETLTQIQTLKSEGKEEEANQIYSDSLEIIKPAAEDILSQLDSGEISFTDAIGLYGEDEGMDYYPDGYEVCEGFDRYVPEFTEGSMSLSVIGEYTNLVATDYGYHIIEYYSDVPSEITPYEDVATELYMTLLEAEKSNRWLEFIEQWPIELNLKFKDEKLGEMDVY